MITLEKDEHIILEVRKHWFFLATEICLAIIFILLPILLFPVLQGLGLQTTLASLSLAFFVYSLWVLSIWVIVFIFWTNHHLNLWLITNQKIFNIEQHRLFKREVSVISYEKIQDITYHVSGIIPSILGFGDLHIQTAGTDRNFEIKGIKDPAYIQKKLNEILLRKEISN